MYHQKVDFSIKLFKMSDFDKPMSDWLITCKITRFNKLINYNYNYQQIN